MSSSIVSFRWLHAFAAGTLSALLCFAVVRPGAPEAGANDAPPLAVAGPVQLFGAVVPDGTGFAVHVRAVNGEQAARRCRITATVTEVRDNPMSRVIRLPQPLWRTDLALLVASGGTAESRVAVPADVAARLTATPPPPDPERLAVETIAHGVMLQASCPSDEAVG